MAAKKTTPKKSGTSAQGATKRTHPSRESRAASPAAKRRKARQGERRATPLDAAPSLTERVQVERDQIFKALSIVECCRFATATLLEVDDPEYMIPAFEAVCGLLSDAAEQLERIASACEKLV